MTPTPPGPPPPPPDWTESPDTTVVEFSDADYPWQPVPREELDNLLKRRRPQGIDDTPPSEPTTPAP